MLAELGLVFFVIGAAESRVLACPHALPSCVRDAQRATRLPMAYPPDTSRLDAGVFVDGSFSVTVSTERGAWRDTFSAPVVREGICAVRVVRAELGEAGEVLRQVDQERIGIPRARSDCSGLSPVDDLFEPSASELADELVPVARIVWRAWQTGVATEAPSFRKFGAENRDRFLRSPFADIERIKIDWSRPNPDVDRYRFQYESLDGATWPAMTLEVHATERTLLRLEFAEFIE